VERPSPGQVAAVVAVLLLVAVIGVRTLRDDGRPGSRAAHAAPSAAAEPVRLEGGRQGGGSVVVHVAGAVRRPGVYRLREGARVDDAVRRAGGALRSADLTAVNLAAKAEDGRQVVVPRQATASAGGGAPGAVPVAGAAGAPGAPLNLNQATAEQLDGLDGIGPGLAAKILAYRDEHGGFGSVDELDQVPGIGATRLAALRDLVTV
jgi:competence protein ComEA